MTVTKDGEQLNRSRKLLVSFIVAAVVVVAVHFLDFPGSVPRFTQISGGGVLLDVRPSFSTQEVYSRLAGYGPAGRAGYAFRNLTTDILLPLTLLPLLLLLMLHAVRPLNVRASLRWLLLSFAVVYVVFDLAENAMVLVLLRTYPERVDTLAGVLPIVTSIKRVASLLALLVPLALLGVRRLRKPRPPDTRAGLS